MYEADTRQDTQAGICNQDCQEPPLHASPQPQKFKDIMKSAPGAPPRLRRPQVK